MPIATNVYVGAVDKIRTYQLDAQQLTLDPLGDVATGADPSFMAFDHAGRFAVAVNEGDNAVESFRIAPDGTLTKVSAQPSGGVGPTHVELAPSSDWVFVGNYGDGTVSSLPVAADGTLGPPAFTIPVGEKAHQVVVGPGGGPLQLFVPCLGANHIAVLDVRGGDGWLAVKTTIPAPAGAGPRHIAFHPSVFPEGRRAFVINELASSITAYSVSAAGTMTPLETVSTLPAGFAGPNTGAEIAVHRNGTWIYASNRGHDSIVRFRHTPGEGLSEPRHVSTCGPGPRHFSLALDDTAMYVANQGAGSVHAFRIPSSDGVPVPVGEVTTATGVTYVGVRTRS